VSDSDLRQALLGTWRLISWQVAVDGTIVKPFGENPQGYLVYTADGHVLVNFAARDRAELFGSSGYRGPVLLQTAEANTPLGFAGYCGTFEVRDGQAIHHRDLSVRPSLDGHEETRSVMLDGDRLILATPRGDQFEWQRVH
jgi:hypothetical protein